MANAKTKDGFEFSCDACGEVWQPRPLGHGSAARDFKESWDDAKRAGWRAIKNKNGDWENRCPDCA